MLFCLWTQIQLCLLEAIVEVLQARDIKEIDLIFIFLFYYPFLQQRKSLQETYTNGGLIHVFTLHFLVLLIMDGWVLKQNIK